MSIKPVDFQVMLPKTSEVSKLHNDEQQRNQGLHLQQAEKNQHRVENNLRQVHSQENAQEARIKEKQEKERGNKKEKEEEKKRNKQNYTKNKKLTSDNQTSTIDIRL